MWVQRQRIIDAIAEVTTNVTWVDHGQQMRADVQGLQLCVQDGSVSVVRQRNKSAYVLFAQEDVMSFTNELKKMLAKT